MPFEEFPNCLCLKQPPMFTRISFAWKGYLNACRPPSSTHCITIETPTLSFLSQLIPVIKVYFVTTARWFTATSAAPMLSNFSLNAVGEANFEN